MSVEYDLVIIGSSLEGIAAAASAAKLNARVALVEQSPSEQFNLTEIYSYTLSQRAALLQQLHRQGVEEASGLAAARFLLAKVKPWAEAVASAPAYQQSPAVLAALGVDVISGRGEFCRLPNLAFLVNNRQLRSRAYLIATGSQPVIPNITGLHEVSYLTTSQLSQYNDLTRLPQHLLILGNSPLSVELAQSLRRFGKTITLVSPNCSLLPYEERDASRLIQAQLEAEGIQIFTASPVLQVRRLDNKKWVQAGDQAFEADEIILASPRKPNVEGLNLEGVGVKISSQGISVNDKLQTTNPRIYACGDVLGGYSLSSIAQYEADIAIENALFFPLLKVDYRYLPWVLFTDPQLARVGLTEAQARRWYNSVHVIRQAVKENLRAQVSGETTGFCKLVIRSNGEILGAHIVGPSAGELIGAIALAMKQKIKLGNLTSIYPSATFSEIINQAALANRRDRLSHKLLRSFCKNLFMLQRSRLS